MSEPLKQVKLTPGVNEKLIEMSKRRKEDDHLNPSKQGIVAELILNEYKRITKGGAAK